MAVWGGQVKEEGEAPSIPPPILSSQDVVQRQKARGAIEDTPTFRDTLYIEKPPTLNSGFGAILLLQPWVETEASAFRLESRSRTAVQPRGPPLFPFRGVNQYGAGRRLSPWCNVALGRSDTGVTVISQWMLFLLLLSLLTFSLVLAVAYVISKFDFSFIFSFWLPANAGFTRMKKLQMWMLGCLVAKRKEAHLSSDGASEKF